MSNKVKIGNDTYIKQPNGDLKPEPKSSGGVIDAMVGAVENVIKQTVTRGKK